MSIKKTRSFSLLVLISYTFKTTHRNVFVSFHPIFFYPDCLFWKFCSLRSQNNQRTRLCLRLRLANRQVLLAWLSLRPISSSQLHTLLHFHLCPIYLVVFKGSYRLCGGYLILRGASRLDAFSVYPFPTWLPGCAIGMTTGAPEVSPSRSSRTKDSSSQISYAHAG